MCKWNIISFAIFLSFCFPLNFLFVQFYSFEIKLKQKGAKGKHNKSTFVGRIIRKQYEWSCDRQFWKSRANSVRQDQLVVNYFYVHHPASFIIFSWMMMKGKGWCCCCSVVSYTLILCQLPNGWQPQVYWNWANLLSIFSIFCLRISFENGYEPDDVDVQFHFIKKFPFLSYLRPGVQIKYQGREREKSSNDKIVNRVKNAECFGVFLYILYCLGYII